VLDEARAKGIDIAPKYIPAEVFDKRAVEKNQVVFHDVSYIEVKPHITKGKKGRSPAVAVELTDFSVFYSQDSIAHADAVLGKKKTGSQIVVEKGHIVKLIKDKKGIIRRESLTQHWTDWIDYWSVDFDFESKREIIRVPVQAPEPSPQTPLPGGEGDVEYEEKRTGDFASPQTPLPKGEGDVEYEEKWTGDFVSRQTPPPKGEGQWEERWTGDFIFENEWQSFRTKKVRSLELKSVAHQVTQGRPACRDEPGAGRRKIAVKVVDIFGSDTMTTMEVSI